MNFLYFDLIHKAIERKFTLGESMFLTILVLNDKRKKVPVTPNSGTHFFYTRNLFFGGS